LDAQDRLIGLHVAAIRSVNHLHVTAREVFKPAILCSAVRIVLLHNHPSGEPAPSPDDEILTRQLELAGMLLGIVIVDHVVVGFPGYVSLRETDRMLLPADPEEDLTPDEIDERMHRMLGFTTRGKPG
jgi:DNA repair protein RadC